MDDNPVRILVELEDPGVGESELERATTRVRSELLELEVDSVERLPQVRRRLVPERSSLQQLAPCS